MTPEERFTHEVREALLEILRSDEGRELIREIVREGDRHE